jgi:magnesium-transporting ATPase (P-type)
MKFLNFKLKSGSNELLSYATQKGFNENQIKKSRNTYGENVITHRDRDNVWSRLPHAFINPLMIVIDNQGGI